MRTHSGMASASGCVGGSALPQFHWCVLIIAPIALLAFAIPARATVFASQSVFESQLGISSTDTYASTTYGYAAAHIVELSDGAMDAKFAETRYITTTIPNRNVVGQVADNIPSGYCAGCNGDFLLDFTATTVGTNQGVFGIGFFYEEFNAAPEIAEIVFGDGTFEDITLPTSRAPTLSYFGITSDVLINTADFITNTGDTPDFAITDLTIGGAPTAVPEPTSLALLAAALVGLSGVGLRKHQKTGALLSGNAAPQLTEG